MSRERRGLQDGNDRVANIARWLGIPIGNDEVNELILYSWRPDENPTILSRWPRKAVSRDLAPEINQFMVDFANDEMANAKAKLSWVLPNGDEWTSKPFKLIGEKPDRTDALDGTPLSLIMQMQRHNEAFSQKLVEMADSVERRQDDAEKRWVRMFDIMDRQLERTSKLLEGAQTVADEATAEAATLATIAEEATATAAEAVAAAEQAREENTSGDIMKMVGSQLGIIPAPTQAA